MTVQLINGIKNHRDRMMMVWGEPRRLLKIPCDDKSIDDDLAKPLGLIMGQVLIVLYLKISNDVEFESTKDEVLKIITTLN